MKRLLLLRHAKAVISHGESDRDRALAPRGLADAARVGRAIAAAGWTPDMVLVSDARRTRETLQAALPPFVPAPVVTIEPRLYEATPSAILARVAVLPPEPSCVLVVGHNPGIAAAAQRAARRGAASDLARLATAFPTAALAVLRYDIETWSAVPHVEAELEALQWVDPLGQAD